MPFGTTCRRPYALLENATLVTVYGYAQPVNPLPGSSRVDFPTHLWVRYRRHPEHPLPTGTGDKPGPRWQLYTKAPLPRACVLGTGACFPAVPPYLAHAAAACGPLGGITVRTVPHYQLAAFAGTPGGRIQRFACRFAATTGSLQRLPVYSSPALDFLTRFDCTVS